MWMFWIIFKLYEIKILWNLGGGGVYRLERRGRPAAVWERCSMRSFVIFDITQTSIIIAILKVLKASQHDMLQVDWEPRMSKGFNKLWSTHTIHKTKRALALMSKEHGCSPTCVLASASGSCNSIWNMKSCIHLQSASRPIYIYIVCLIVAFFCLLHELHALRELPCIALIVL